MFKSSSLALHFVLKTVFSNKEIRRNPSSQQCFQGTSPLFSSLNTLLERE
ncbi:hypothetical protein Syun_025079 [Stephania yunnanensis]|uniref:Uncharacterized protein n=1 Tax=Stephania yunnanensis TaxID=152371 RepID=A0AAP0EZS9_9MAGN